MDLKNIKTLPTLKKTLKKFLPAKISKALQSYDAFCEQPISFDAKEFSAHHNACKAAVVHAQSLLKLAVWTDDEQKTGPELDFSKILEDAKKDFDCEENEDD